MKKIFSFTLMLLATLAIQASNINLHLTGCTSNADNPTEYTVEDDYAELYFTAEDGYAFDGWEVTVKHGETVLPVNDYESEIGYVYPDASYGYVFFIWYGDVTEDFDVTIVCQPASEGPAIPETFSAATFEEFTLEANSVYRPSTLQFGDNWLTSGGVVFSSRKEDWGSGYFGYSGIQVVNYANGTATGTDVYLPAATAAAEGENYATVNIMGLFSQVQFATTTLSGMLINNTAYNVNSFQHGDGYARPLAQGDWFKVTFTGLKDGVVTNSFDYYLADYRTAGAWTYVSDWTWVDLSSLGEINALQFALDGTDKGQWGLNTSSYFCFDNLGGEAPITAIRTNKAANQADKMLLNGQVVIRREGKLYNVAGQAIR